jgi:hypothetical protein
MCLQVAFLICTSSSRVRSAPVNGTGTELPSVNDRDRDTEPDEVATASMGAGDDGEGSGDPGADDDREEVEVAEGGVHGISKGEEGGAGEDGADDDDSDAGELGGERASNAAICCCRDKRVVCIGSSAGEASAPRLSNTNR